MKTLFQYRCSECNHPYERAEVRYLCPVCANKNKPNEPLHGVLEVVFPASINKIDTRNFRELIAAFTPLETEYYPKLPVGNTPFHPAKRLGNYFEYANLWIKNDGLNPSGSLKDRASWLLVGEANRLGIDTIVAASTGNAASALAAVAAAEGKRAIIFVPESAPRGKLLQMLLCGAQVIPVQGTYDDAFAISLAYTNSYPGLNRNTAYHPLTIEGKKTAGLEIYFQNQCRIPDAIVIPVGDGVILRGIYKAFADLLLHGIIDHLPRLIGIQAEGSAAIHRFVVSGKYTSVEHPHTVADSIAVSTPSNAFLAYDAIQKTNGCTIVVSDEEILSAQAILASHSGVFAEPAAATTVAAIPYLSKQANLDKSTQIVLLITGHGLKDPAPALARITVPAAVKTLDEAVARIVTDTESRGNRS
ncbi:MAG: threonine synthase [bacterium]|nr:threonine synthase [bacterium]